MIFNEESQMLIKWEEGKCFYFLYDYYLFIYFLTITLLLLPMQLIGIMMCASIRLIIGISQQKSLNHLPRKDNGYGLLVVGLCRFCATFRLFHYLFIYFLHTNLVEIYGIFFMRTPYSFIINK